MTKCLIAALATVLAAGSLRAQAVPDSVNHRNDCRLARQTVLTGHPASHLRWALGYLALCGSGERGEVVAQAIRRLRTETDTSVLRPYWRVSHYLLDRQIFEAAEEIALDRFAIAALISGVRSGVIAEYEQLVGGFRPDGLVAGRCWSIVSGRFQTTDTPLPADAHERAAAVRLRLRQDPSEPLDVRTAAACLLPRRR